MVYHIIENIPGFGKNQIELPLNNRIQMTEFRSRNHRLPIKTGVELKLSASYGYASNTTTLVINTTITIT